MSESIPTGDVHHIAITVNDVARSRQFYTGVLNFQVIVEFGPRLLLTNGSTVIALTPPSNPGEAMVDNDRFSENRIGLDHLSFAVQDMSTLEEAMKILDANNIPHGEIRDLGEGFGICVLAFRDPDNVQLELSAPRA